MVKKDIIQEWLDIGETEDNITHMIIVLDNEESFPIYVTKDERIDRVLEDMAKEESKKPIAVYNFSIDIAKQLSEEQPWHL